MPRQNQDNNAPLLDTVQQYLMAMPVVFCGVNRKVNIGNYENIDVLFAVAVPVPQAAGITDPVALKTIIEEVANENFATAAEITAEKYFKIKDLINNK